MQAKKNIRLLISLAISTLVLALLFYISTRENFDTVDAQLFKVDDQTTVSRVLIKPTNGEQVELSFAGGKWRVNNSFDADQQMIKILFATLLQTEPRREVAASMQDSISNHIKSTGRQIALYDGENLVKQFWVGGNDRKTETYFQLQDDAPYVVQIPGYRLYIASVFELPANEWRDKWIFNFNWQNFKSLTASFPKQSKEDFTIAMQQTFFGITDMPTADTAKLNTYLDAVSLVQANRFVAENEFSEFDSLIAGDPEFTLKIEDIANRKYILEVYPTGRNTQLLARLNQETLLLLSPANREAISRKRSYFGQ
jgi:Domain of unknown function (DUF4340)